MRTLYGRTGGLGHVPGSEVVLVAAGGSCISTISPVGRAGMESVVPTRQTLPTERRETLVKDRFVHVVAYAANEDGLFTFGAVFHGQCQ